jgi:glycosyltransferase involved in cell wall biosynthesis
MSGGVKVSVRRQAEFLSLEHDVVVLATRTVFPGFARYSMMKEAQGAGGRFRSVEGGLKIYRPPCVHVPFLWKVLGPLQILLWVVVVYSVFEKRVSLVHAHRCFPVGFAACLAAAVLRLPIVLTTYGSDVNAGLRREAVGVWVSFATRYALRHASIVIAVSKALAEKIESAGTEKSRIRVIPSGVDAVFADVADKEDARRRLGLPHGARVVLMASNLVPVKDPLTMLRAFLTVRETVNDATLVILGKGELEETLRSEVNRLNASGFVLLKGKRPREEIPFWVAACDVVALSSLDEGCPVIALEGFVSGKPFVGTAVGGVPEIVPDESIGILAKRGDPFSLARALKTALEKQWDAGKLVRHGLTYSWENVSVRISRVYDEACGLGVAACGASCLR